jgi:hypothetical protein
MAKPTPRPQTRPRLLVEELEPRILYSADAAALLGVSGLPGEAQVREFDAAAMLGTAGPLAPTSGAAAGDGAADATPSTATLQAEQREIIFVDSRVPDAFTLTDALMQQRGSGALFDIVMLEADEDGVAQINQILASEHDLAAIHVISHGSDGALELGNTRLDEARLAVDADAVAPWGRALSADGDLLLYGCDVAQSAAGQAFVQHLARLTGADVAASTDLTGSAAQGGDWDLEYRQGVVESGIAVGGALQDDWRGTLGDAAAAVQPLSAPLAFEENTGQTDAVVDFLARGSGYVVFLTDGDAVLALSQPDGTDHVVRLDVLGANPAAAAIGEDLLASRSNYLTGSADQWHTDVANYGAVTYHDVYDGIDLRYYGSQRQLEYDFIVAAGADADTIRLDFQGVLRAEIADNGDLLLTLNEQGDQIAFKAPVAYQDGVGGREAVVSRYLIHDDGSIGFELGSYDISRELVIDPVLSYVAFLGGTGYDTAQGIAVDDNGNVYITGWTASADYPIAVGALDQSYNGGSYDIYVAKLNASGNALVYSTFIGGSGNDMGNSIAVDGSGNVYVAGQTASADLPVVNGYQSTLKGTGDAVLLKLNSAGSGLLYSTYFGGTSATGGEVAYDLALDGSGNVYLTGQAYSADMPLKNAFDATLGGTYDAFVAKFDLSQTGANSLLYSSLFGGSGSEYGTTIAVDSTGAFTIAGQTDSTDLATVNAYQSSYAGAMDGFITRFNSSGNTVTYSTYLGGATSSDWVEAIAVDAAGSLYVGGKTAGGFPTTAGAYDTTFNAGSADGFVVKIDPSQSGAASAIYSTYLGGTGFDYVIGIDVDASGNAYLGGFTGSAGFPTTADGADRVMTGSNDGFFAVLNATGTALTYSTFLGGSGQDRVLDVDWNAAAGSAYVAGLVGATDGPTASTTTHFGPEGGTDAFVAKFTFNQAPVATANSYSTAEGVAVSGNVITDNTGAGVDSDPDGDPITASLVSGPLHGTLSFAANGAFTYTPYDSADGTNFGSADSFTYQVSDGKGGTTSALVSLTVTPNATNEAPVHAVPGAQTVGDLSTLVFSEANGNRIVVRDDSGTNPVQVTLAATNGSLTLAGIAGLSFSAGDGTADLTMTFTGTLNAVNTALNGLVFAPGVVGAASVRIITNDQGYSGTGGAMGDDDTIAISVVHNNLAPVNTVPGAQATDVNGMVLFANAIGTQISVSDADAGGNAIQVTLTATNGTINLSGNKGLSFSSGDGTADATMIFTGTVADINAALDGMTFAATANFTGAASLQIVTNDLGNTGAGGTQSDSDTVSISVRQVGKSIWVATVNDVSSPGGTGLTSWTAGQVLKFGPIGGSLLFEPGTTTGTFSLAGFNLDSGSFGDANTQIDALHLVSRDMTAGGFALQKGDLLFSTAGNETLGGVAYEGGDIVLFRPTTPGNYSAGTFSLFFDRTDTTVQVTAFTLIEQAVTVGNVTLNAGDLLISNNGSTDILRFVPTQLGDTTAGSSSVLIAGADLGFGKDVAAIDVVEQTTVIGNKTLAPGTLIVSLVGEDTTVGSGTQIAVTRWDLFTLDVVTTGVGTTSATATLLFQGADVALDNNNEAVQAASLIPNQAPTAANQTFGLAENSANGTVVGTVAGTDPEGGTVKYAITGGNSSGAFTINAGTGQISVANSAALDFEATPVFILTVAAIDPDGAYGTATVTVNLSNVNEAPVLDNGGTMVLTSITEDQTNNSGNTVAQIIASAGGDRITDPDAGAAEGIAVTGLASGNGTWQYSINGGTSWNAVGPVSDTSALLLRATDKLRFVPDALNADAASITFRAWDQGSGSAGSKVDASVNGGMAAFSTATETASITVTAVNDAPGMAGVSFGSTNEDTTKTWLVTDLTQYAWDSDTGALKGLAIVGADNSNGTWQYTLDGTNWFNVGAVAANNALLLAADATSAFRFVPNANWNGATGMFQYKAWDQTSGTAGTYVDASVSGGTTAFSGTSGSALTVNAVNDAPVVTSTGGMLAYSENQAATTIDPGLMVSDVDSANLTGATVTISGNYANGQDVLAFTNQLGITGIWNATTGVLTLTGTTTVANYQTALRSVTYVNTSENPSTLNRTVSFVVSDGAASSVAATRSISVAEVNDAPVADDDAYSVNEDTTLVVPADGVLLNDADVDGNAITAVLVSGPSHAASFTLNADGSFSYTPAANWNGTDSFTYKVNDGTTDGNVATATITVNPVNDAPTASNAGAAETYTEDTAKNLTDIVVSDVDSANVAVTLTLSDVNAGSLNTGTSGAVTSTFVGGVWTASGAIADVNALLAGLMFTPTADFNSNFNISTSVSDGIAAPVTGSKAMTGTAVNDAPTGSVTIDDTTPTQGQTLTASNTLADADGLGVITYTWKADGSTVGTGSTYLVSEAEVGKVITVEASYTDGHGTVELVSSTPTAAVTNVNDAPTGSVTIDDTTPSQGQTLTASNTLADADGLGVITYTWKADGAVVGAGGTYTVTEAEVGKVITVEASYTDGHGTNEVVASAATAAVANVNDAPTGSVTIDDTTPTQGQTLTVSNTLADADGLGVISYTWKADGSTVGTGSTYLVSESEVGKVITVEASYTDGHGTAELVSSAATAAVANVNDAPTGSVTIDDTTPAQGQTLTASNTLADADGLGTISYTWKADGATVGTGSTYLVTEAEVGKVITVEASYTDGHGTSELVSSTPTAAVTNVNDAPMGSVTIDDMTPTQGQTLTASNTLADADGLGAITYTWKADGAVVGAGGTYIVSETEVGKVITVEASYTDGHGTSEVVASAATAAVANVNDAPTGSVTIDDTTPTQGQTLTASNTLADADGLGAITYTWKADGAVVGAGGTYIVTEAEVGKVITVEASYTDGHGTPELVGSAPTAAVANVNDAPTGSVTIDDTTPTQGQTLTASNTLADADGLGTITYTWKANGSTVGTGSTYTVTEAEVGKVITVEASYTDGHGTAELVSSAATAAVANVNDAPTGSVTIDDTTPTQGQTLTASNTLADADGLGVITYTWKADGSTVGTGSTYLVSEAEVGKVITVEASYTDRYGTPELVSSAPTAGVANFNDAPTTSPVMLRAIAEDSGTRVITQAELLANASDMEGDALTAGALTITAGNGTLVDNRDGTWNYTPALNDATGVRFSYTIADGNGGSAAGSADLDITPVNDAPTAGAVTLTAIAEDSGVRVITQAELLAGAADVDGPGLTATHLAITSGSGRLEDNGDGTWSYTPASNDDTSVTFGYTVTDGGLAVDGSASLDITPVNDAPSVTMATLQLSGGQNVVLDASQLQAADPDDPAAKLSFVVAGIQFGRFEWVASPGIAIDQFSQADVAAGRVRLVSTSADEAPSFSLAVRDGQSLSAEVSASFLFTPSRAPEAELPGSEQPATRSEMAISLAREAPPVAPGRVAADVAAGPPRIEIPEAARVIDAVDAVLIRLETTVLRSTASPHVPDRPQHSSDDLDTNETVTAGDFLIQTFQLLVQSAEQSVRSGLSAGPQAAEPGAVDWPADENESGLTLVETAQMTGLALTAGTVWWALRAGGLLTGLLVSLPTWRHADLLAVLPDDEDDADWDLDDDDEAARDEQAVGQLLEPGFEEARQ